MLKMERMIKIETSLTIIARYVMITALIRLAEAKLIYLK